MEFCQDIIALWEEGRQGGFTAPSLLRFTRHLIACEACRSEIEADMRLDEALRQLRRQIDQHGLDDRFPQRVLERLPQTSDDTGESLRQLARLVANDPKLQRHLGQVNDRREWVAQLMQIAGVGGLVVTPGMLDRVFGEVTSANDDELDDYVLDAVVGGGLGEGLLAHLLTFSGNWRNGEKT